MPLLNNRLIARALLILFACTLIFAAFFSVIYSTTEASTIIYVEDGATGANNGTDWANAYTDLQDAIANASSGDQIWVGRGLYSPGSSRTDTFQLKDGVEIYGGFAGTEATLEERTLTSLSILHGDIDDDDSAGEGTYVSEASQINGDNNYHIVNGSGVSSSAVLDGFIIAGGNADGTLPNDNGGGIFISSGSPTLRNLELYGNTGGLGGAIYISDGSPILQDILISGSDGRFVGGGIYIANNSNPNLTNLRITKNESAFGGGIASFSSNLNLTNVTLYNNTASSDGGGIYSSNDTLNLINVTVVDNTATRDGGGLYNTLTNPTIVNSIVWDNEDVSGSGTYTANVSNDGGATPQISYSFIQNSFDDSDFSWVGALGTDKGNNSDADPKLLSASSGLFFGSPAVNAGNTLSYTNPITTDILGRERIQFGTIDAGAIEYDRSCPAGPVSYVDIDAVEENNGTSWIDAHDDLTRALWEADLCDSISEIWVADGTYKPGTEQTDTFNLSDGVSIYGGFNGTETLRTQRDWENNVTILSGDIDNNDGGTFPTGQNSYNIVSGHFISETAVLDGFTIQLGAATVAFTVPSDIPNLYQRGGAVAAYKGNLELQNLKILDNSRIAVYIDESDVTIKDSIFQSNATSSFAAGLRANDSQLTISNTQFIDNLSLGRGGAIYLQNTIAAFSSTSFSENESDDDGGAIFANGSTLSILGGTYEKNIAPSGRGGAIYTNNTDLTITNVEFKENSADSSGGAIYKNNNLIDLDNVEFSDNTATQGGALYLNNGELMVKESSFSKNIASLGSNINGGAIYANNQTGTLQTSTFTENSASGQGGAIYNSGSDLTYESLRFEKNTAGTQGGAAYARTSSLNISNSTFQENSTNGSGGAIYKDDNLLIINNSEFSNNSADFGGALYLNRGSIQMQGSQFSNNKAIIDSPSSGGAIYTDIITGTVETSSFAGNEANRTGGAILLNQESELAFESVMFEDNSAEIGGAVFVGSNSDVSVFSGSFKGNYASDEGGAFYVFFGQLNLLNTTVSGNRANVNGGGFHLNGSPATVKNSVVYNNLDSGENGAASHTASFFNSGSISFSHSIVENTGGSNNWQSILHGTDLGNNLDIDPLFKTAVDPNSAPTAAGDLTLQATSPAIDVGDTASYTATLNIDAAGNSRIENSTIDLGAYEAPYYMVNIDLPSFGGGTVSGSGFNCTADCSADLIFDTVVALTATPAEGYLFIGWDGDCTGTELCVITLSKDTNITAIFATQTQTLTVTTAGTGSGTVASTPTGITCPNDCEETLDYGTEVTLIASPAVGSEFAGWSGACSGTETCIVNLVQETSVTATFNSILDDETAIYLPLITR